MKNLDEAYGLLKGNYQEFEQAFTPEIAARLWCLIQSIVSSQSEVGYEIGRIFSQSREPIEERYDRIKESFENLFVNLRPQINNGEARDILFCDECDEVYGPLEFAGSSVCEKCRRVCTEVTENVENPFHCYEIVPWVRDIP